MAHKYIEFFSFLTWSTDQTFVDRASSVMV